jgi:hypothetical protein
MGEVFTVNKKVKRENYQRRSQLAFAMRRDAVEGWWTKEAVRWPNAVASNPVAGVMENLQIAARRNLALPCENERLEKSCEFEVAKPSRRENALAAAMKRRDRR